jgi:hypothetical protein
MEADFTTLKTVASEHSSECWDFIKYEELSLASQEGLCYKHAIPFSQPSAY